MKVSQKMKFKTYNPKVLTLFKNILHAKKSTIMKSITKDKNELLQFLKI